jgi:ABC-2 type transport system permease protein
MGTRRMKNYVWLVRREFWENKAIWIIPAAIGCTLTIAALFGRVEIALPGSPQQSRSVAAMALYAFGAVFFVAMSIYSCWYLLECLHADRKDRSVLFWKSMPISDTATVLSKLFVGLIAVPAVYFAAADLATLLMAGILSARMSLGGVLSQPAFWQPTFWLQLQVLWVYVILTTAIWFLPITGWLLVVSAWAKRAAVLWAILPPLAAILAEHLFMHTHVIANVLSGRLVTGYRDAAFYDPMPHHEWSMQAGDPAAALESTWRLLDLASFLSNPQTWIGVLCGAGLIGGAIQLRMRRAEA